MIYETGSIISYDDEVVKSKTPKVRVLNLPAKSYAKIENIDIFEDGWIYFSILEIKEENKAPQKDRIGLHEYAIPRKFPDSPRNWFDDLKRVKCEVKNLDTNQYFIDNYVEKK